MDYVIKLDTYQGPFDLLLDLIAQQEIDILDIQIAVITEQYLEYLHSLQEQDLAIGGEFLVMAATLLRIKARTLLPEEQPEQIEEDDEVNTREQLIEQLMRYKAYKQVAEVLTKNYQGTIGYYTRGLPVRDFSQEPLFTNPVGETTVVELGNIFRQLITELHREVPTHEVIQRVSLSERLAVIRIQLVGNERISFAELLRDQTVSETVVTFMAILELVRLSEIKVRQVKTFGEIQINPSPHMEASR